MAWDRKEPQNTTRIRNLGNVIRPNFQAIEDADATFRPIALNLFDRSSTTPPNNDPAAVANAVVLYAKQDASGNQQIYAENPAGTISALTSFVNPTAGPPGSLTLPGGIIIKWGSGTLTTGSNNTTPFNFAGGSFSNMNYIVTTTIQKASTGDTDVDHHVVAKNTGNFTVHNSTNQTNHVLNYIAIGN